MKFAVIFIVAFSISKCATADAYNDALLGHIVQSKINGDRTDVEKLFEHELKRNAHLYALETIIILEKYLPQIIEGVTAKMRQDADRVYKESLLEGSTIND
jgi:hypothetical protein|tara:strand:+ start:2879 stop:3181 length:303 start_codon:yes stop_codon:yes gene_type:complete